MVSMSPIWQLGHVEKRPDVFAEPPHCVASSELDGGWSQWSMVGPCSATCGQNGKRLRVRSCSAPAPSGGGRYCPGDATQKVACNINPCPGQCDSIGRNLQTLKSPKEGYNLMELEFKFAAYQLQGFWFAPRSDWSEAPEFEHILVHGGWSEWAPLDFTPCSVTCGNGTQSRNRSCTNPVPAHNGFPCTGIDFEQRDCTNPICNSEYLWSGGATEARHKQAGDPESIRGETSMLFCDVSVLRRVSTSAMAGRTEELSYQFKTLATKPLYGVRTPSWEVSRTGTTSPNVRCGNIDSKEVEWMRDG